MSDKDWKDSQSNWGSGMTWSLMCSHSRDGEALLVTVVDYDVGFDFAYTYIHHSSVAKLSRTSRSKRWKPRLLKVEAALVTLRVQRVGPRVRRVDALWRTPFAS